MSKRYQALTGALHEQNGLYSIKLETGQHLQSDGIRDMVPPVAPYPRESHTCCAYNT